MKLIDPKNLIMHLNDWMFAEGCEEGWNYDKNKVVPDHERQQAIYDTIQQCIDAVMDQPTVDAEPVVRCKDCRFYDPLDANRPYDCLYMDSIFGDDYCSRGEKLPEPIVYPQVEGITPTVVKMDEVEE